MHAMGMTRGRGRDVISRLFCCLRRLQAALPHLVLNVRRAATTCRTPCERTAMLIATVLRPSSAPNHDAVTLAHCFVFHDEARRGVEKNASK